mgnify:CR=1 FL=1
MYPIEEGAELPRFVTSPIVSRKACPFQMGNLERNQLPRYFLRAVPANQQDTGRSGSQFLRHACRLRPCYQSLSRHRKAMKQCQMGSVMNFKFFFFALFAEVLFPSEDVIFGNNFSLIENTVFPKSIRKSRAMRKKYASLYEKLLSSAIFLARFF